MDRIEVRIETGSDQQSQALHAGMFASREGEHGPSSWLRRTLVLSLSCMFSWLFLPQKTLADEILPSERLERGFQGIMRPRLERYCFDCHAGDTTEAEIDLAALTTSLDAGRQIPIWIKVRRMLDSGQMPPPDAVQPNDQERAELRSWLEKYLANTAATRAGDPGPVVLRRLSNAEYTYTIRDLTGVETLDPAREFPVDGAAGEGFTNVGSGQGMSPALVQKYLDAAKQVARHAVLLPTGICFSRATTRRDHTDEWLARIRAFYGQFTEQGGGSAVDLQGIKFETNQGGLLPIENYFAATLAERDALVGGRKTIDQVGANDR